MANPLLIKGLLGLGGVAATGLVAVKLIEKQSSGESVHKENKGLEEGEKEKPMEKEDEGGEENIHNGQNQCSHTIDNVAKKIKTILSNYYEGDWEMKSRPNALSEADKTLINEQLRDLENWKGGHSTNCKNHQSIEENYGKIVEFLKDPDLANTKKKYREPMKEMLKAMGISTWMSY